MAEMCKLFSFNCPLLSSTEMKTRPWSQLGALLDEEYQGTAAFLDALASLKTMLVIK